MPFNISEFATEILRGGTQTNAHYEVVFSLPPIMQGISSSNPEAGTFLDNTRQFRLRTKDAVLPGVGIRTRPVNRYGLGQYTKYPVAPGYTDTSFVMLMDRKGFLYNFWYSWLNLVANFVDSREFFGVTTRENTVNYKDDYVADIQIIKYDEGGNIVSIHVFERAYPTSINEINLSWNDTRKTNFSIGITFDRWRIDSLGVKL